MDFSDPVFDYLLVKVSSRCNINCSYCYWFSDPSVYEYPKRMSRAVADQLLFRIKEQILAHDLRQFHVLLHGGEPMLWGKPAFDDFCEKFGAIGATTGAKVSVAMTTNGILIDEDWVDLFTAHNVSLTLSIDGNKTAHDRNRRDFMDMGTYDRVMASAAMLTAAKIDFGVLSVADPTSSAAQVYRHFVDELGFRHFDILIPDATHEDAPAPIAQYYCDLFDLWYRDGQGSAVDIRLPRSMLIGVLGGDPRVESIGYGPIQTCTILPDGSMEPLDVLRIAGEASTRTKLNIFSDGLQDIVKDPVWRNAFDAAQNLSGECMSCEYRHACGGGYLPHRYSAKNGYDNPSVYCSDYKTIFDHIWDRVEGSLFIDADGLDAPIPIAAVMRRDGCLR